MKTLLIPLLTACVVCNASAAMDTLNFLNPVAGESGDPGASSQPAPYIDPAMSSEPDTGVLGRPGGRSSVKVASTMFGAQLFNGAFRNSAGAGFNPNHRVEVGDRIQVRMWGAFTFDGLLTVDPKGNVFLPNVGPIAIAGTPNANLNAFVESKVRSVYRANVGVYASLATAQPVKVFVTGFVKQPGLYGGTGTDSVLSYLDRAGGVDPERGSYVDVVVNRAGAQIGRMNLYDFLLNGHLAALPLHEGDVVVVGPRQHTFSVEGEVFNAYDFEFEQSTLTLARALEVARVKPGATHVSVVRRQGTQKRTEYYAIAHGHDVVLQDGDKLIVTADRYAGTIQVRIEGAHSGEHAMVLPYGATMADVLTKINATSMSRVDALQLYRKSVAVRQKEMLDVSLQKLQQSSLSATSSTNEEASLRVKEADLLARFIAQAKQIEPRGQVVLSQDNIGSTLLEDGDIIRIPEKSSLVMVHGEVIFPNAVSWQDGDNANDYIERSGGYLQGESKSRVVVIRQNGEVVSMSSRTLIDAGDEIMVLPKVQTKHVEVTRGITQILYQIAVAAKVVLGL
ncbi:polysaccharide biosynthesis/export family protein [Pandoraea sp. NPDC087047]|uniref:polysaccharide biosynthesis/export family protein n=1 Tax=Pandoraea sp. NPDC087047 TaxID=3364390 RepID=UPI00380AA64C